MSCCGLVQLRFAIPYRIRELPTLATVLRVLCERPLAIVFLNCIRVKRVWARFAPALTLVVGNQFVSNTFFFFLWPSVFFFLWPSASAKRARIARHLVKSILYGIWVFRNKATFYNVQTAMNM